MDYDKTQYTLASAQSMTAAGVSPVLDSKGLDTANLMVVSTGTYAIQVTEDPQQGTWMTLDTGTAANVVAIAAATNQTYLSLRPAPRYLRLSWTAQPGMILSAWASLVQ